MIWGVRWLVVLAYLEELLQVQEVAYWDPPCLKAYTSYINKNNTILAKIMCSATRGLCSAIKYFVLFIYVTNLL